MEGLFNHIFSKTLKIEFKVPFTRLSYEEAINRYGLDKPDLRYSLELKDFNKPAARGKFEVFRQVIKNRGTVKALVASKAADFFRKKISELEETARVYGAKGLAWMKVSESGLEGGISRFYSSLQQEILNTLDAKPGDLILLVGAEWKKACTALGAVRSELARQLKLYDPHEFNFCWITDFPLFEWNSEENKWEPAHHMFTIPQEEFIPDLEKDPGAVMGDLYDLICSGTELGSGSIRIHNLKLQQRIFNIIGISKEDAKRRFGFLMEAFQYGPPPHGGIAVGLDRLVMLMAGELSGFRFTLARAARGYPDFSSAIYSTSIGTSSIELFVSKSR